MAWVRVTGEIMGAGDRVEVQKGSQMGEENRLRGLGKKEPPLLGQNL
jgi:hypothetical protein